MFDISQTSVDVLAAIVASQRQFISADDPALAFERILDSFIKLSGSQFGVLVEANRAPRGGLGFRVIKTSGIAWDESSHAFYDRHPPEANRIPELTKWIGEVFHASEAVIGRAPDSKSRVGKPSNQHTPVYHFLGLPIVGEKGEVLGAVGLANRPQGYNEDVASQLQPLGDALSTMIRAVQREGRLRTAEESTSARTERDPGYLDQGTNGVLMHDGDVSTRAQPEEALRDQFAVLQTILDSTTDFIYMKDCRGRYVTMNAAAAAFIGRPLEEIIGRDDSELFPADIAREIQACDQRLFADATEQRFEEKIRMDSRLRHLFTSKNVCRDSTGKVIGLVGITRDVTAHVEAENALLQSTMLFESIVEHIPLAVFVKDPTDSFRIRLWNKAAESIFGLQREAVIGRNAYDYWPQQEADFYHAIDEKVMRDGRFVDVVEESSTTGNGDPIIVHTRKLPLFDRDGKPSLLLAICENITARKQSEEALIEAQRRLEFTLQGADVGLWDWDLNTNDVVFSEQWKTQLGYHGDEVTRSNLEWQSRVHPDDLAQSLAKVEDAIERRTPEYRSEFRMRHKDGSWRWILSRGAVIDDASGKAARMLGVHIDITDRKRAEEALQASERRYRTFVDHATDALFLQDHTGRVLDVNQQACASLGYERDELIGLMPSQFDPDASAAFTSSVLRRLETGETVAFDSQHRRKDGTTFPVEVRLRPFWIGEQRFHIGLVRDITERKGAEEALRESEARLRTLLENLDKVAVQAYEAGGTITFWNRASELFYGYTAAEALGRNLIELLYAEPARDIERKIMADALRSGRNPAAEEIELVRRDDSRITVFSSRVVHSRPGKPPEFFCFDVDVSERKRAEEELAMRQAELLHASRLTTVGQMVAELSHEVAQPLSAIGNFAAACERILDVANDPHSGKLHEYIRAIVKQNERCMTILTRLRDFSRRTAASRAECNIDELLRDSVELISNELRRHHVTVRFELADDLAVVWGDRIQLQQVVVNLLTNARDAVRDQVLERRVITIRASTDEEFVEFEVSDLGCGIPEDFAKHVFEPFVTTKENGMGIGLSICQSIVKEHSGRIDVQSHADRGAAFRVRLPRMDRGRQ